MPTPSDPNKITSAQDLLEALGAITSSSYPQALKLMQIIDTTSTAINPQLDSLSNLINNQAMSELKLLGDEPDTNWVPIDYTDQTTGEGN
jgi:hypothetical protein